jgi:2-methylaconitate cis-trans-isomerase PrpF
MDSSMEQYGIPAAYIRGGTSKAVFLSKSVIPSPGPLRDRVLKRIMGSPDPMQIDGIGLEYWNEETRHNACPY